MNSKEPINWQASALKESKLTTFLLGILVVFAMGVVLNQLQSIFKPLLIAIFLSFVFDPIVLLLRRAKVPKFIAIVVTLLIVFVIFYLLGLIIYASIASFLEEYPTYQAKFIKFYQGLLGNLNVHQTQIQEYIKEVKWGDLWKNLSLSSFISSIAGSFVNFLMNLFLVLLFTVYIMLGKDHVLKKVKKAFPEDKTGRIPDILKNINRGMEKYLVAKTFISLGTGAIATIILYLFNIDFAIVWGLLTFLLNFIPNVGSTIATIPPILVCFFQYGSLFPTLWMSILLVSTQMTMGNVVEPRVMGKSLNLSPLVVIVSLIFWAIIWGPVGMILAVPISSAIQIICANIEKLRPISVLLGGEESI